MRESHLRTKTATYNEPRYSNLVGICGLASVLNKKSFYLMNSMRYNHILAALNQALNVSYFVEVLMI